MKKVFYGNPEDWLRGFYLPFGHQNYCNRYDNFESGMKSSWYAYSGHYNPFSLY
jgi:hypothetical protein